MENETSQEFITTVEKAYQDKIIHKSPILVIDGELFEYNTNQDTIKIPFSENRLKYIFMNPENSIIIYGNQGKNGSIIFNTIKIQN